MFLRFPSILYYGNLSQLEHQASLSKLYRKCFSPEFKIREEVQTSTGFTCYNRALALHGKKYFQERFRLHTVYILHFIRPVLYIA